MNIPSNLKYTKDHEWVKVEGDIATVGITDYARLYQVRLSRSTQLWRRLPRLSTAIPTEKAG